MDVQTIVLWWSILENVVAVTEFRLANDDMTWSKAREHCRNNFQGDLISREQIGISGYDIAMTGSIWTRERGVLTQWFEIRGCYADHQIQDIVSTIRVKDNVVGRCARYCLGNQSTDNFGIKGTTCICIPSDDDVSGNPDLASRCNTPCVEASDTYLCGGASFYTIYSKAPRLPSMNCQTCSDPVECACSTAQCQDPNIVVGYAEKCSNYNAASCEDGLFEFVLAPPDDAYSYNTWRHLSNTCALGHLGKQSSYIDSAVDIIDRSRFCPGNANVPKSIWTSILRRYVPLTEEEAYNPTREHVVFPYCRPGGNVPDCGNYFSPQETCGSGAERELKFICTFETSRLTTADSRRVLSSGAVTYIVVAVVCGVVVLAVIIIVLLLLRRRRNIYQREKGLQTLNNDEFADLAASSKTYSKNNQPIVKPETKEGSRDKEIAKRETRSNDEKYHYAETHETPNNRDNPPHKGLVPSDDTYDHTENVNSKTTHIQKRGIYNYTYSDSKSFGRKSDEMDRTNISGNGNDYYDHTGVEKRNDTELSEYYDHLQLEQKGEDVYDSSSQQRRREDEIISDENVYDHSA